MFLLFVQTSGNYLSILAVICHIVLVLKQQNDTCCRNTSTVRYTHRASYGSMPELIVYTTTGSATPRGQVQKSRSRCVLTSGSGDYPGVNSEELEPPSLGFVTYGIGNTTLVYTSGFLEVRELIPPDIARNQVNNSSKTIGSNFQKVTVDIDYLGRVLVYMYVRILMFSGIIFQEDEPRARR